ncbi:MAG: hypothetical protein AAF846_17250 [Chloroflexota bacterium]
MTNKDKRRPIIDPVLLLLKSRRVLIALTSLLVSVVVMLMSVLEPLHSELLILVMTLALSLITGLSIEDAVIAARQYPFNSDVRELLDAAADAIIDEILDVDETWWDEDAVETPQPSNELT